MIKQATITTYKPIVEKAIQDLFNKAWANQKSRGDFLLFLCNAHFDLGVSKGPLISGPGRVGLQDYDRIDFFMSYANSPFEKEVNAMTDEQAKKQLITSFLHIELMIFTHFWESEKNLKDLKQLANLVNSDNYDWENQIPEFKRGEFIRKKINGVFKKQKLDIGGLISDSYHSQIRNAFAHGNYSFSPERIFFSNYDSSKPYQIPDISFEDWEKRLIITALIFEEVAKYKREFRMNIGNDSERQLVYMKYPSPSRVKERSKYIVYYEEIEDFRWE